MSVRRFGCVVLSLLSCFAALARQVTDTVVSAQGDRLIVIYDVIRADGRLTVTFQQARKKLGRTFAAKYKKLNEVAVVFFDRTGNYRDIRFSGLDIESFMVPVGMRYQPSADGYFLMHDNPSLALDVSPSASSWRIPMYLAHYEGKGRYCVFSRCADLVVKVPPLRPPVGRPVAQTDVVTHQTVQTISSQEELESSFTDADEVGILIRKINDLLHEQESYPFTDELCHAILSLHDRKYRVDDVRLTSAIDEVLSACREKEERLKALASAAAEAKAAEAGLQARKAAAEARARQDSIAAEASRQATRDKKRNIWMMAGGLLLVLLAFVGNQVLQHVRNVRNQKNLMDMQASVVKRAENEARRRAQNMASGQFRRMQGDAREKTGKAVDGAVGRMMKNRGRNNKGISI